ncbi:NAD-dependent epimerase/dehydratase family protein [Phenylobacterium sp.]|uniref:NAD-dependent epimerase/dehydratase family protein n=1 Tax=Phenylobacterium sp. TaxID=1871053 RepID=UPI002C438D51|nr:NAD-dependent epimerase/dehydratase family protein [Phenylobacterium sp.]HVI31072.1 NAD-dependent epimerase/dehydratase family protein [Phenylobacterium sp.]
MRSDRPSVVSFGPAGRKAPAPRVAAVIGGAGFIGSHLCEALLARGREVVCIDNLQRGTVHNLAGLIGEPRGQVVCHDVARRLPDHLPRFDEIYHLVAAPEPAAGYRRSARVAVHVLDRASRDGARVLLATAARPGRETRPPGQGTAEDLFMRCAAKRGVALRVARIFDSYGPRMHLDSGCEVAGYVMRALRGEPLTVPDGRRRLQLCFVDDVVQGCIRLMDGEATGPRAAAEPTEVAIAVLANAILQAAGLSCGPDPGAEADGPVAGEVRSEIHPQQRLREGLERTIADFAARSGVPAGTLSRQRVG